MYAQVKKKFKLFCNCQSYPLKYFEVEPLMRLSVLCKTIHVLRKICYFQTVARQLFSHSSTLRFHSFFKKQQSILNYHFVAMPGKIKTWLRF